MIIDAAFDAAWAELDGPASQTEDGNVRRVTREDLRTFITRYLAAEAHDLWTGFSPESLAELARMGGRPAEDP